MGGDSGREVWGLGLVRLETGAVGSNSTQDIDVCPRPSVFALSSVRTETLRRADLSSKGSHQMSN